MQGQSEATPLKQKSLQAVLDWQVAIVNRMSRYPVEYLHIDLTSGSGWNDKVDVWGSPVVAMECLERLKHRHAYRGVFVDKDPVAISQLKDRLAMRIPGRDYKVECMPNDEFLKEHSRRIKANQMGSIYIDPNGAAGELPWCELHDFCRSHPKMDIIINYPATTIKRVRRYEEEMGSSTKYEFISIEEWPEWFHREYWDIREPYSAWHWTMLVGRNFPTKGSYPKYKFRKLTSEVGQHYLAIATKTAEELKNDDDSEQFGLF